MAAAVGLSRSAIERRFHRDIGRGVAAELIRKRLERCRELLLSTDDSIQAIAPLVGFRTPTYLQRVFRDTFGTTPHNWRVANAESAFAGATADKRGTRPPRPCRGEASPRGRRGAGNGER